MAKATAISKGKTSICRSSPAAFRSIGFLTRLFTRRLFTRSIHLHESSVGLGPEDMRPDTVLQIIGVINSLNPSSRRNAGLFPMALLGTTDRKGRGIHSDTNNSEVEFVGLRLAGVYDYDATICLPRT